MIGKRSRTQVGKPAQRFVDRRVPRQRRAGSRVVRHIIELTLVRLDHSSGSDALPELAALRGGFWRDLVVAALVGFIAAAAFFAGAFRAVALLPDADFAVRAIASLSCARKSAISSRSA